MRMSLSAIPDDLTNLNWVAGTPVPINSSVSPPNQSSRPRPHTHALPTAAVNENATTTSSPSTSRSTARKPAGSTRSTPRCRSIGRSRRGREDATGGTEGQHKKPNCSYTCLIVMALQASENGCLPVNEIYKFIEQEFPFFKTARDGWKNSIRHNLSLNPAFRKVERSDGWRGKKGFFWEMNPDKKVALEVEVKKFLRQEGRTLNTKHSSKSSAAIPSCLHAAIPVMPFQSSPMYVYPASQTPAVMTQSVPQLPSPQHTPSYATFNTHNTPSQYLGISAPATNPQEVARDLFGLELCPEGSGYGSPEGVGPLYTTTPTLNDFFGVPLVVRNTPSPLLSFTPSTHMSPYFDLSPEEQLYQQQMQYVMPALSVTPPQYFTCQGPASVTPPSMIIQSLMHAPISVEGSNESPVHMDDLLDIIDETNCEPEDPLHIAHSSGGRSAQNRSSYTQSSNQPTLTHHHKTAASQTTSASYHSPDNTPGDILSSLLDSRHQSGTNRDEEYLSPLIDLIGLSPAEKAQLEREVGSVEFNSLLTSGQSFSHSASTTPGQELLYSTTSVAPEMFPQAPVKGCYGDNPLAVHPTSGHSTQSTADAMDSLLSGGVDDLQTFDVLGEVTVGLSTGGKWDQELASADFKTDPTWLAV